MRYSFLFRTVYSLLSFYSCTVLAQEMKVSQEQNFYISCYYNDSNENKETSDNPKLIWPSVGFIWGQKNYYWALDSIQPMSAYTQLSGHIEDGFFLEETLTRKDVLEKCNNSLLRKSESSPSQESYKLYDFYAAQSNFSSSEFPIHFLKDENNKKINQIVIFGDSLSDTGNVKKLSRIFPYYPYWYGRFSDGFIWVDFMKKSTQLPILNFSHAGAKTEGDSEDFYTGLFAYLKNKAKEVISGNLKNSVSNYLDKYLTEDSYVTKNENIKNTVNTLYIIWIGGNDLIERVKNPSQAKKFFENPDEFGGSNMIINRAVNNVVEQIMLLQQKGATQFLILNLPDLGKTPVPLKSTYHFYNDENLNKAETSRRISEISVKYNFVLNSALKTVQNKLGEKIQISTIDVFKYFEAFTENKDPFTGNSFEYGFLARNTNYKVNSSDTTQSHYIPDVCYKKSYIDAAFVFSNEDSDELLPDSNLKLVNNIKTPSASYSNIGDFAFDNTCKDSAGNINKFSVFWDSPHPSSYSHCWIAYVIEKRMLELGYISTALKSIEENKEYCIEKIKNKNLFE